MELPKKLWHKITYTPLIVFKKALILLGVIFGLYQGIAFFFPAIAEKMSGWYPFLICVFISIIYGRWRTWKPFKINFKISHTNTTIEVSFGDLFTKDGLRAIAVSEFFDSKIGKPVSEMSLHGIFIKNILGGYSKIFDDEIKKQLATIKAEEVPEKTDGKNMRYPIGATAIIEANNNKYIMFALTQVKPLTCKAYCDVATMWIALKGLWEKGRIESGGNPINVPLVGSGQSGVGLPARDLLDLIILSAITETKERRITATIRIILQYDVFEEFDLRDIKQHWKE